MERNDDFSGQNPGLGGSGADNTSSYGAGSTGGTGSGFGAAGAGYGTAGTTGTDFGSSTGTVGGQEGQSRLQQAKDVAADKLGTVKEKVGNLNSSLADKLEAGAEKLRQRNQSQTAQFAGATDAGSTSVAADQRMAQLNDRVASGMQNTADWLRNGDLQQSIEQQVRTNPGRTLLIALGVGYVLGKAFRK